jgi:microcin C transport system substrate-binding protein
MTTRQLCHRPSMILKKIFICAALGLFCYLMPAVSEETIKTYALTPKGKSPKYGKDHPVDFASRGALKGGEIRLAALGNFDTLNPYTIKGKYAAGLTHLESNFIFQSLGTTFQGDPYSVYGLIAHEMEYPSSHEWINFHLRPEAYFHDKTPILADDVVFTFNTLRQKGNPFYKAYYADVKDVVKINAHTVRFNIKNPKNHEIFHILAQLPVLSQKFWKNKNFMKELLTPPVGSGPYKISKLEPGRYIVYEKTLCWSDNLPMYKGWWNFKTIRYDYYRDSTLTLQAFLSGEYDVRQEVDPIKWLKEYKSPSIDSKKIIKEEFKNKIPSGFLGLFYNLRNPVFQNIKLREALMYFFDFEWVNKTLFYNAHTRINSYFNKTEMAATGIPLDEELAILKQFEKDLPKDLFTKPYFIPQTDGSGNMRAQKRKALELLKEGGYSFKKQKLIDPQTNKPLTFEIILQDPHYEKVIQPFVGHLRDLGCDIKIHTLDSTQYQSRIQSFKYDMTVHNVPPVFTPGNEQKDYWWSHVADMEGSKNIAGLKNSVVDQLLKLLENSESWEQLMQRTKALDRVLLWQHLAIPLYSNATIRLVSWDIFGKPEKAPAYGLPIHQTWWIDPQKQALIKKDVHKKS